jgi:hypothetical protein
MLNFLSCAYVKSVKDEGKNLNSKVEAPVDGVYQMVDKSGNYLMKRDSGFDSSKTNVIVKRAIYIKDDSEQDKYLEKSVTISAFGKIKDRNILRPDRSQFTVWFDGQKYFSEMSLIEKKRALKVKMESNEEQWNKTIEVPFPSGSGLYCFFSQIMECAKATGFLDESQKKKAGQMSFHIIWEGYPYFQEQYEGIPNEVFTPAQLVYDGRKANGESRYSLMFGGQAIIYFVDKDGRFLKMFWIAQGLSIAPTLNQNIESEEE